MTNDYGKNGLFDEDPSYEVRMKEMREAWKEAHEQVHHRSDYSDLGKIPKNEAHEYIRHIYEKEYGEECNLADNRLFAFYKTLQRRKVKQTFREMRPDIEERLRRMDSSDAFTQVQAGRSLRDIIEENRATKEKNTSE